MKRSMRRGFTLVELLIVIVVIGVLSAMMMLSSTEAVSSARANNIVSNLRNWKTAALSWYTDNIDKVNGAGKIKTSDTDTSYSGEFASAVHTKDIMKYLADSGLTVKDNDVVDSSGGRYFTDHADESTGKKYYNWLIGYEMPAEDANIAGKLQSRAGTTGLLYKDGGNTGTYEYSKAKEKRKIFISVIDFTKN